MPVLLKGKIAPPRSSWKVFGRRTFFSWVLFWLSSETTALNPASSLTRMRLMISHSIQRGPLECSDVPEDSRFLVAMILLNPFSLFNLQEILLRIFCALFQLFVNFSPLFHHSCKCSTAYIKEGQNQIVNKTASSESPACFTANLILSLFLP